MSERIFWRWEHSESKAWSEGYVIEADSDTGLLCISSYSYSRVGVWVDPADIEQRQPRHASAMDDKQREQLTIAIRALCGIRDYPIPAKEVTYDDFVYERMQNSYRDAAVSVLKAMGVPSGWADQRDEQTQAGSSEAGDEAR